MASSGTYLNLTLPDVGSTLGPTWATTLNNAFVDLDDHDHSTQGKSIPSAGLNINADVEFNDNSATELKGVTFQQQSSSSSVSRTLYADSNSDLYYRSSTGSVRITRNDVVFGGFSHARLTNSTSTSLTIADSNTSAVFIMKSSTARGITMPSASDVDVGRFYLIKDGAGTASTANITITPTSTQTIDGGTAGTAITISTNYGHAWLISDGSNWFRLQN